MSEFKQGDLVKSGGGVYKVCGFTGTGSPIVPAGWLMVDEVGSALNPKFCELYTGATSVLPIPVEVVE